MTDEESKNQRINNDLEQNAESTEWNTWIVASGSELKEAFGLTAENRPTIKLNPERVPDGLRVLIPYAEEWGIDDDLIRADVIRKASPEKLEALISTVSRYQDSINEWLAGPEAYRDEHTKEYYTFSALVTAFDESRYEA